MTEMSAAEAAARLGVSPRHVARLAAAGELTITRRVGGNLLLDSTSVHQRKRANPHRGRPLTAAGAWTALRLLSDERADNATGPSALSRLHTRLRRSTADDVAWMVRRRALGATRMQGWGDTTGLVPTGLSALADERWSSTFELSNAPVDGFDGYAPQQDYAETANRLGLMEDREGDYSIRLVPAGARWEVDHVLVAAVAVDLMESLDTRAAAAGRDVLTRLLEKLG